MEQISNNTTQESVDTTKLKELLEKKPELKYRIVQLIEQLSGDKNDNIKNNLLLHQTVKQDISPRLKGIQQDTESIILDLLSDIHESHFNPKDIYNTKKRSLSLYLYLYPSEKYKDRTLQAYESLIRLHKKYIDKEKDAASVLHTTNLLLVSLGYHSRGREEPIGDSHNFGRETIHQIEEYIFTIEQRLKKRNMIPENKENRMNRDTSIYNGVQYMDPKIIQSTKKERKKRGW